MNLIEQLKQDRARGVLVCNLSWDALIVEAERLSTALADMQARMGGIMLDAPAVPAQTGMPAAPAAAVVTVDTPEFVTLLHFWMGAEPGDDAKEYYDDLISHIDAYTAQAVAAAREEGNTQGWTECEADMKPEYDAMRHRAEKAEADILALYDRQREDGNTISALRWHLAAAPQQHAQAALSDEQIEALRSIAQSWMSEAGRDSIEDWIATILAPSQPHSAIPVTGC